MLLTMMLGGAEAPAPGGTVPVVTPAGRVITIPAPDAAGSPAGGELPAFIAIAAESMDPADEVEYVVALGALLEAGEQFASINLAVTPSSVTRGFQVLTAGSFAPVELDDKHVRIWVTVAANKRGDAAWSGSGSLCGVEFTAATDSVPPRTFQRTVGIRVVQK